VPAYTISQVRGVLLEEAIAALLQGSGFRIVTRHSGDRTLKGTPAGLAVRGRGTDHQIDVIGDFRFVSPFTNPLRLLVEGKYWSVTVGLPVVRNAVGIQRDVSEWFLPNGRTAASRFHYQSAIFSATPFSVEAQRFAYAHDIVLVPLAQNSLFAPVIEAIRIFTEVDEARRVLRLRDIRATTRSRLLGVGSEGGSTDNLDAALTSIGRAINAIGSAYLARTSGGLPLFLVPPTPDAARRIAEFQDEHLMTVRYSRQEGWWLELVDWHETVRFSFDLPSELLRVFKRDGRLNRREALNMKLEQFDAIHAYRFDGNRVRAMTLRLDDSWVQQVDEALQNAAP
jgi:hypothetical protein